MSERGERLRIRDLAQAQPVEGQAVPAHAAAPPAETELPSNTPLAVIHQLIHDVTTYVCRDELRTRERSFVYDAILRLCCREDVDSLVINSHSQGTIIAFDVLRQLPPFALHKVRLLITAGSPLRKYADLFAWGTDAGCLWELADWINFWDRKDPVADPLIPQNWHFGMDPTTMTSDPSLFHGIDADSGDFRPIPLRDIPVDNVQHTPSGGLPAHNYWDNEPQFVVPLAALLRQAAQEPLPDTSQ